MKIEVTESTLMKDPERAAATLAECRQAGFGIAIDDFGTGYSSLSYLSTLPVTTLKVDRAFVRAMLSDQTSRRIVQDHPPACRRVGTSRSSAEGIEQAEEADILTDMGCAFGQGYLFGRPMPLDAAVRHDPDLGHADDPCRALANSGGTFGRGRASCVSDPAPKRSCTRVKLWARPRPNAW